MKFFSKKNKEREEALQEIRRFILQTSVSNFPETAFRVFGLTGKETCHNVTVTHTKVSPYTLTQVTVRKNTDADRPVSVSFYWRGVHLDGFLADRCSAAFGELFPEETK